MITYLVRQISRSPSQGLEQNPRHRGRRRRRNPLSQQHKILLGVGIAGAVGLGAWGISRAVSAQPAKGKKATGPAAGQCPEGSVWSAVEGKCVTVPVGPGPGEAPSRTKSTQVGDGKFDYIGDGDNWPAMDKYPNQAAIAQRMNVAGYGLGTWTDPGFNFAGSNQARTGVRAFQNDWSAVVKKGSTGAREAWTLYVSGTRQPPVGALSDDGLIGPNTWKALRDVIENIGVQKWQGIVAAAKAHPFS